MYLLATNRLSTPISSLQSFPHRACPRTPSDSHQKSGLLFLSLNISGARRRLRCEDPQVHATLIAGVTLSLLHLEARSADREVHLGRNLASLTPRRQPIAHARPLPDATPDLGRRVQDGRRHTGNSERCVHRGSVGRGAASTGQVSARQKRMTSEAEENVLSH